MSERIVGHKVREATLLDVAEGRPPEEWVGSDTYVCGTDLGLSEARDAFKAIRHPYKQLERVFERSEVLVAYEPPGAPRVCDPTPPVGTAKRTRIPI